MKIKLTGSLVCVLLLVSALAADEGPKHHGGSVTNAGDQTKRSRIDPCSLLTSKDIQAVQGVPVQETKPSDQPGAGLIMSQCLFRTATPDKSISVAVASPGATSPRTFWKKQFHPDQDAAKAKDAHSDRAEKKPVAENKEEEEHNRPRAISGVGEEAYWVGGPIVGALYVLKGNTFLRVSVGGIREESARIEKSVTLARAALKRL
jgi:hypothetical protein